MINHMIKLDFLGGAMEVGGSAILVEMDGRRILLDSGIRQKAGADPMPEFRRIQERGGLDAIVISHAHMDHTGTLPVISKAYPLAPIYATSMTIDLTRVLLYDSIKLMERQEDGIPVYASQDVEAVFNRFLAVRYEQPLEILPGITLTMYQAGHIAGAACIYLQSKEGTVFYSGDFSSFSQNTIEGIRIPKLRPDIAIVESTYGDRLHANRQVEEHRLVETVAECIARKGKMIIPTFALGRAQEVLLILRRAINKGEIPPVRVYVDGMVRDINIAYTRNPWFLKNALAKRVQKGNEIFYSDQIVPVGRTDNREELLCTEDPVIFVSSSGMLTGGPSVEYAKKIAPMENGYIVITGYQDEEAPGRQILELLNEDEDIAERTLRLNGSSVPVRCTIQKAGLSAHGDKSEIEALLERLSARNVFLVHGDESVIRELAGGLNLDYRTKIYTPVCGESETVYLKSPRKQLKKQFPYTMQKTVELSGKESEFYQYLTEHYPGYKFTIADLAFIWYGTPVREDDVLEELERTVLASRYFETDARRLFLFVCRDEAVLREEEEKSSVMTVQRLQEIAEECFSGFPYRKLGYYTDRMEVRLQFDFPRDVDGIFDAAAEKFAEQTGWRVVRNLEPNEQAMQTMLRGYLGKWIQKISIRKMEGSVVVRLAGRPETDVLKQVIGEFEKHTGYFLFFEGVPVDDLFEESVEETEADLESIKVSGGTSESVKVQGKASESVKVQGKASESVKVQGGASESVKVQGKASESVKMPETTLESVEVSGETLKSIMTSEKTLKSSGNKVSFLKNNARGIEKQNALYSEADWFYPETESCLEQNMAFSCVDLEFEGMPIVPYKKSLMNDSNGKYIQLAFLSPELGRRCRDTIQRVANQTGWRIRIAPGVNQNAISSLVQQCCREKGILLRKLPSYQPQSQTFVLKLVEKHDEAEAVCEEIWEKTGVACKVEYQ